MPHAGGTLVRSRQLLPSSYIVMAGYPAVILSADRWKAETNNEAPTLVNDKMVAVGTSGAMTVSPQRTLCKWICPHCHSIAVATMAEHDYDPKSGLPLLLVEESGTKWAHCGGCDRYWTPRPHADKNGARTCTQAGCQCRLLAPAAAAVATPLPNS